MKYKKAMLVFMVYVVLCVLVQKTEQADAPLKEGNYLLREGIGEDSYDVELVMELDGEETNFILSVPARRLTKAEEEACLQAAVSEAEEGFLMGNASLDSVQGRVGIRSDYQGGLVLAEWDFQSPGRIRDNGEITEEGLSATGEHIQARVYLTCEDSSLCHEFYFTVYPKEKSEKEALLEEIETMIIKLGEEEGAEKLFLPEEVSGYVLKWKNKSSNTPLQILFLGIVTAILVPEMEKQKNEEMKKKRQEKLLREYPEMVNKLSILLGAGMTLLGAWSKVTAMYLNSRNNGVLVKKEVYEEMLLTQREIESGKGELQAYEAFGERCGIQKYRKFSNYLTQNLKKGNRSICSILEKEAEEVFEERKSLARKYGEEAGTKMLFPMLLMLGIVVGIIMVPAVISFQSGL